MRGIIFILAILGLGGVMDCTAGKSINTLASSWKGKFPVFVIAHRGFSGAAPENTLIAFKKAMELGVDMIELDVHLSKDGQVVVIHDDTLHRTTNGKGKVTDYTLYELKQLDAGSWFRPQFSGEKIPTLREVLELTRGHVLFNIEIKGGDLGQYTIQELTDRTLNEVKKMGMEDQILFSSFDPSPLLRIKEKNPKIRLNFLYNKPWNSVQEVSEGRTFSMLTFRKTVLTKDLISKAQETGVKVNVYTLNTEEEMEHFLNWGIDGIITDHPDRLIQVLKKRN